MGRTKWIHGPRYPPLSPPRVQLSGIISLKSVGSRPWIKTDFFRDKEGAGKWRAKHCGREVAGKYEGQWIVKGGVCLRNKVMLVGGR